MRAILSGFAAAAVTLAGAAHARTVNFAELSAASSVIELGGARLEIVQPAPLEMLSRAELRDAGLLRCSGLRDALCGEGPPRARSATQTLLQIYLDEGVSLSNLSFADNFAGEAPDEGRAIIVNGIAYRLGDLSKLTLTGQPVVINLDAAAAQQLSLRSFDLSSLDAPLPAAGFLMLAGLGGIALAKRHTAPAKRPAKSRPKKN